MTHTVRIQAFAFGPDRVEVSAGDTVVWTNDDLAPHTATSVDAAWDTGALERGGSAALGLTAPGRFTYNCRYHPHMTGEVVVSGEATASPTR